MDRTDKRALVLAIVDSLKKAGSTCGETHIQKSCFVLQSHFGLPTNFNFVLYKHGPYSFDLQEYLNGLRGDDLLSTAPTNLPYGTSLCVTERGKQIEQLRKSLIEEHSEKLDQICQSFGRKNVRDLEKIATAVYVTQELGDSASAEDRAKRITYFKKHVSYADALAAVKEADEIGSSGKA